jgi:uncharacterized protein YuzE
MNRTYDNSTDSLYLEVHPPSRRTAEMGEDIFLDLDEDGNLSGKISDALSKRPNWCNG